MNIKLPYQFSRHFNIKRHMIFLKMIFNFRKWNINKYINKLQTDVLAGLKELAHLHKFATHVAFATPEQFVSFVHLVIPSTVM